MRYAGERRLPRPRGKRTKYGSAEGDHRRTAPTETACLEVIPEPDAPTGSVLVEAIAFGV